MRTKSDIYGKHVCSSEQQGATSAIKYRAKTIMSTHSGSRGHVVISTPYFNLQKNYSDDLVKQSLFDLISQCREIFADDFLDLKSDVRRYLSPCVVKHSSFQIRSGLIPHFDLHIRNYDFLNISLTIILSDIIKVQR